MKTRTLYVIALIGGVDLSVAVVKEDIQFTIIGCAALVIAAILSLHKQESS